MTVERFPMPSALKTVCAHRGVAVGNDVRAPIRALDDDERAALESAVDGLLAPAPA
jgi:dihydrodipicolinate synthase/N-acetylneuraminate lyase